MTSQVEIKVANFNVTLPRNTVEQIPVVLSINPPLGQVQGRLAPLQPRLQLRVYHDLLPELPQQLDTIQSSLSLFFRHWADLNLVEFCGREKNY